MKQYSFIDCNYFTKEEEPKKNMFKNAIQNVKDLWDMPKHVEYYPDQIEVKDIEKGE